eukprot:CAMPEP_0114551406 /NCGR_PEP_ID=MMETSP0114-20121206/6590_1 /TAXON_ID=31324 /ORGANISM="Goniomonas sp, Strain m" /LENGTH=382 /DNA_ID=CAMNT_0001736245 /DNA_START=242 /DNA_END=1390 /DNA_ORIENTATION=+
MRVLPVVLLAGCVQLCFGACPAFVGRPIALSAAPGGSATLNIRVNEGATVTACVLSPVTASPSAVTGIGAMTFASNSFTGYTPIKLTISETGCSNVTTVGFWVDPPAGTTGNAGNECNLGHQAQLGTQNTAIHAVAIFSTVATSCRRGYRVENHRCVTGPSTTNCSDMTLHWKLDAALPGTNLYTSLVWGSMPNLNLTAIGATAVNTTRDAYLSPGALSFPYCSAACLNNRLVIPAHEVFRVSTFTWSFWIKSALGVDTVSLMNYRIPNVGGYAFFMDAGNKMAMMDYAGQTRFAPNALTPGEWTLLQYSASATEVSYFVNGVANGVFTRGTPFYHTTQPVPPLRDIFFHGGEETWWFGFATLMDDISFSPSTVSGNLCDVA